MSEENKENLVHYVCSVCGYEADLPEGADTTCPVCGVAMDKKD